MAAAETNADNTPAATGSTKNDEGGPKHDHHSPWKEALECLSRRAATDDKYASIATMKSLPCRH